MIKILLHVPRQIVLNKNLLNQSWRVRWEEVELVKSGKAMTGSTPSAGMSECSGLARGIQLSSEVVARAKDTKPTKTKDKDKEKQGKDKQGKAVKEKDKGKDKDKDKGSAKDSSTRLRELLVSSGGSCGSSNSISNARSLVSIGTGAGQLFAEVGIYRGVPVAIKHVRKEHLQLTRRVLMEFNEIKDMVNENLNVFVGVCIDPPNICVLWKYCSKGSLTDVLENENYKLDSTFKWSFMTDICRGMHYIHQTSLGSHGNLKSSNCIIDSRWSLKITDYGLPSFLANQEVQTTEEEIFKKKLWMAPELLRENFPNPLGTQKGDVYSFAIVSYEIMMRSEPFNFDQYNPRDVVNRVRNGESIPFRPVLPEATDLGKPFIDLVKMCWEENPDNRPTFKQIRRTLAKLAGGNINIMDSVMMMMEKYAQNLEDIVEERAQQLLDEKQKTDRLLYRLLPPIVAERLKAGSFVQPEQYDQASIYFSDIVGFTTIACDSSPMQIVEFLNDLYSCFDDIIGRYDVYKVETIGDAYLVVSGVPQRNGTKHSSEIADVSLDLLSAVTSFRIRHRPDQQLQLRIGLHSGPVVAGVVGNVMPRYCLFGDTVNMAQMMESCGRPLHIHASKFLFELLTTNYNGYLLTKRGETNIKVRRTLNSFNLKPLQHQWTYAHSGKGFQTTYWLHGKKGFEKPLPAFDRNEGLKEDEVRRQKAMAYYAAEAERKHVPPSKSGLDRRDGTDGSEGTSRKGAEGKIGKKDSGAGEGLGIMEGGYHMDSLDRDRDDGHRSQPGLPVGSGLPRVG